MSVPLTIKCSVILTDEACGHCGDFGNSMHRQQVIVQHAGGTDISQPLCPECIEVPELMVLTRPEVKPAAGPPGKRLRKKTTKRERQIAEDIGGRRQPASGAMAHAKGDVRLRGKWRVDDKTTQHKSFPISRELLNKVRSECSPGEKFAVTVAFLNPITLKEEDQVVVVDYATWKELVNADQHP